MDTMVRATWIPKNDALEKWVSLQIEHGRARFADVMISGLFVEKGLGNELKTPKVMKFILIVPYITHRLWPKIHLLVLFLEIQHEDIWGIFSWLECWAVIEGSPCRDDQCVFLHLVVLRRFRFLFETPGLAIDSQVIPSFTANGSTRFSSRGILVQDDESS